MRIGIDARSVTDKICGVSRYALCLIRELSQIDTINKYIIYTDKIDILPDLGGNFEIRQTCCPRMNAFYDVKFYCIIANDNLDVFHSFHSWLPLFLPLKLRKIVTIHDIFSVTDPDFFIKRWPFHKLLQYYFKILLRNSLRQSTAVVTVSNFCKKEIKRQFETSKPIKVIYNSPGICGLNADLRQRIVSKKYILYIGNFRSYKNIETLLYGYKLYIDQTSGTILNLVLAGNDDDPRIKQLTDRLQISQHIDFYYRPADEEVYSLYQHANVFVFPSKYEGFGIPPLEAQSFGVPVIISDAEALVETSGHGALIFEKTNPQDLAEKIAVVSNDNSLREQLVRSGYENFKSYSWCQSAAQLMELYNDVNT